MYPAQLTYSSPLVFRATAPRVRVLQLPVTPSWGYGGLGDMTFNQEVNTGASIAQSGAAATAALLVSFGAVTGPIGAAIGAAAAGLIQIGTLIAQAFEGCGQTCVQATNIANQVETYLQNNLDTYKNAPVHYKSLQLAAAQNAQTALNALRAGCSDPSLQQAGQRCISERLVQGGTAPWCPTPDHRGCDWVTTYLNPILNDTTVVPDPVSVNSVLSGTADVSSMLPWVIGGGLALLLVAWGMS